MQFATKTESKILTFDMVSMLQHCDGKILKEPMPLKCPYDQIFYFHFFTFSCTIRPSYSSCQISIHYEHRKSFYFNIYFREFTAAINQPCSKAWLRMGESDVKDSNIPHGLKL